MTVLVASLADSSLISSSSNAADYLFGIWLVLSGSPPWYRSCSFLMRVSPLSLAQLRAGMLLQSPVQAGTSIQDQLTGLNGRLKVVATESLSLSHTSAALSSSIIAMSTSWHTGSPETLFLALVA